MGLALETFGIASAAGIASSMAFDVAIDRSMHSHSTFAYRNAKWTTHGLAAAAGVTALAGLAMRVNPGLRDESGTVLAVAAGLGGAWAATLGVRLAYGMVVDPVKLRFAPNDVALNSMNRLRMMGREHDYARMPLFDAISMAQGHPKMIDRVGEFTPVIRDAVR